MPQCFGCHVVLDRAGEQQDHIQGRPTPGRWNESRSFTRFQNPPLGLANGTRVMPFSPCQVVVSVHDRKGRSSPGLSVGEAAMTSFDPHSTAKQSRTCLDCHLETKSLGQGSGFRPFSPEAAVRRTYDSSSSPAWDGRSGRTRWPTRKGPPSTNSRTQATAPFPAPSCGPYGR